MQSVLFCSAQICQYHTRNVSITRLRFRNLPNQQKMPQPHIILSTVAQPTPATHLKNPTEAYLLNTHQQHCSRETPLQSSHSSLVNSTLRLVVYKNNLLPSSARLALAERSADRSDTKEQKRRTCVPPMAPGVVVVPNGGGESASLLDDDGSPVLFAAGVSHPPPLHGKATTRTPPGHAFTRLIRSPFAAVLRMTTCADSTDAISPSVEQPKTSKKTAAGAVVVERRREAKRRPSLEQLIRMETTAPPLTPPRPSRKSKPDTTTSGVATRTTVKEKRRAHEPSPPPKGKSHHTVAVVSDDGRRHGAAAAAVKSNAAGDRQAASAKKLVVVLESLRACSRAPGVAVGMPTTKGLNRKKVSAAGGCVPGGKAELFYYRPIPMGRRCRVQHLEETPYK